MKGLTTTTARQTGSRLTTRPARRTRRRAGPRVLLLTSGLGCGHVRAADSIAHALHRLEPGATLSQLDFWSLMNPGVAATIKEKYLELVLGCPDLYSRLHSLDERTWRRVIGNEVAPPAEVIEMIELLTSDAGERRSLSSLFEWALGPYPTDLLFFPTACAAMPTSNSERAGNNVAMLRMALLKWAFLRLQGRMEQRLQDFRPDVVVATQMVPAALVSTLKASVRRWHGLPLVGVLTDFGAHDYWIQPGIDLYCVPHDVIAESMRSANAMPGRIVATGAPLMPSFEHVPDDVAARRWVGLSSRDDRPVILVLGGGLGLGLESLVPALLRDLPECRVIVMAGHNESARQQLLELSDAAPGRLTVRGWTEHMENYIAAADVVIGKSGGLTVAEVLACGRPLLVTKSLQGQESFNVRFLERIQAGRFVAEHDLPALVATWLADRTALRDLQHRAWEAGHRDGAQRIAALALELAGAGAQLRRAAPGSA